MTDAEWAAWLKDPEAIRVFLVEAVVNIGGTETTLYLSDKGYTSLSTDTVPNRNYMAMIKGINITESLSVDSDPNLSVGDIELSNLNGVRDAWMGYIAAGRSIRGFYGDQRWSRADFRERLNGIMAPIGRKDSNTLALRVRDKLKRLDSPLTESKIGGSGTNQDNPMPLCFGECVNITPVLINVATRQYRVHDGAIELIIEVRDNGKQVAFTPDLANGTFTLAADPFGAITCSVQGDKFGGTYRKTVGSIIQRIVTGYGKASLRLSGSDLDATQLATFEAANTQTVGLYTGGERMNTLVACKQLVSSVGAGLSMSRLGLLRLLRIDIPASGTNTDIRQKNIMVDSLEPAGTIDPVAAIKLGFCKNYTPQKELQTAIRADLKELLATDYMTVTKVDAPTKTLYNLDADPVQVDTLLVDRLETETEAQRRLNFFKVPRHMFECVGYPELLDLVLGAPITVYNSRHQMSAGVQGVITRLSPDYENEQIRIGFTV